jgi:hypothetical protein
VLCNLRSLSEEGLVNNDALTATVRQVGKPWMPWMEKPLEEPLITLW